MNKVDITKEELYDLYWNRELSSIIISDMYNCAKITILRKMKKFNIQRRSISEAEKLLSKRGYIRYNFKEKPECIDCGKKLSKQGAIRCTPCNRKYTSGEKHPMFGIRRYGKDAGGYIDGRHPLHKLLRKLNIYNTWRSDVFKRDRFTCQECFKTGRKIEAHHLNPFSVILSEFLKEYSQFSPVEDKYVLLELSKKYKPFWDIDNGQTLCKDCHKLTDSYLKGKK